MKNIFLILLIAMSAAALSAATIDITIVTSMGPIELELYPDVAPRTVANFILYANDDFYDGLIFHRIADLGGNLIIQGGGFDPNMVKIDPTRPPVPNEYNLSNTPGTIAMAKVGGDPDSATTEFFINHGDLSEILNENNNGGFTVFGAVKEESLNIVDLIAAVEVDGTEPVTDIIIEDVIVTDTSIIDNVYFENGEMLLRGDITDDFFVNYQELNIIADEWLEEGFISNQWLTADPNETFFGEFGGAVAIHKNLAIVGAPNENGGTGAAYIFKNDRTQWILQARIEPPVSQQVVAKSFGFSVAIRENQALIGAPNSTTKLGMSTYTSAGVIYAFKATGDPNDSWDILGRKFPGDTRDDALFGYSVSLDSSLMAIGAPGDPDDSNSGAVYVFNTSNASLLKKFSGEPGDQLGYSIALKNRVVAAGSIYGGDPNNPDSNTGAVHVFKENTSKQGDPWEETVLWASDGVTDDWLGHSVDIDNGTILAGATGADDNGSKSGAVYVFEYLPISGTDPNTIWLETDKLTANDADTFDRFGWSVSLSREHAIVGARYNSDNGNNSGSAYLLKRDAGTWTQQEKFLDDSGQPYDNYGHAVAISGNNAIIGAYGVDGSETDSGAAEIIYFNPDADLNGDGKVDLADFAIMAASWTGN